MTLDRHAADRRRFARLLGVDETLGSGLPIGTDSRRRPAETDPRHETSRTEAEADRS